MPLIIVKEDITKMNVDAIVNPANPTLLGGGGIDGEIHKAAGEKLLKKCRSLKGCCTGQAKITKGYELPAKYIIHTVGPVWQGGENGERELLCECYRNSLALAVQKRCRTIAVPVISAGAYGYPLSQATQIAKDEIIRFIGTHDDITVYLVMREKLLPEKTRLYSQIEYYMMQNGISGTDDVPEALFNNVPTADKENICPPCVSSAPPARAESITKPSFHRDPEDRDPEDLPYIDSAPKTSSTSAPTLTDDDHSDHTVYSSAPISQSKTTSSPKRLIMSKPAKKESLEQMLDNLDKGFSETLLHLIDASGMTDAECYKRANIDRKLFSKIRSNKNYKPSKSTVLAFAISLRLNLDDTRMLLARAGFALSPSSKFDVIIKYFITNGNYDIYEINDTLFAFDQMLLGA